ncbi:MAG TPA: YbhB/YbcL family Raf kinase inhibitor-like protein [Acidimicrobiales bacterium]|nr:YbhB/YbcL family Raf kinase inhibitor-like protein [Acidimicrobiales bacterium]
MAGEITVTSDDFDDGGTIPTPHAHTYGGGDNRSPQLSWSGLPEGTRSVAVTVWDPDAPTGIGFVHWVRFDIPPGVTSFDAGAGTEKGPWVDGFTDWGDNGYGGMAPPPGDDPHRYVFTVYALDTDSLGLDGTTTYAKLRFVMRDHLLGTGSLTGRFGIPA